MSVIRVFALLGLILTAVVVALGGYLLMRSQHARIGWEAEDYFTDPRVIALCDAIEDDDLAEIDRLVAEGADVNARGKGNMTPLMWSFIADETTYERMLEHGADPNVIVTDGFGTKGVVRPGDSVMSQAATTRFPNHLRLSLQHGGDPNLVNPNTRETPLHRAIRHYRLDNVVQLIEAGADLNRRDSRDYTPLLLAEGRNFYSATLALLEAGADFTAIKERKHDLALRIAIRMRGHAIHGVEPTDTQRKVVAFLESQGVDLDAAREEVERRFAELEDAPLDRMPRIREGWKERMKNRPWLSGVTLPAAEEQDAPGQED